MYRNRYQKAILLEGFGISPIMSANLEMAPLRTQTGFLACRAGIGWVPGIKKPVEGFDGYPREAGVSFPIGVSYNFWLNRGVRNFREKVMLHVNTYPKRLNWEWFLEAGGGNTYTVYKNARDRNFIFSHLGVRCQLKIRIPPRYPIFYVKASINPVYYDNKVTMLYRVNGGYRFFGGFSLGTAF